MKLAQRIFLLSTLLLLLFDGKLPVNVHLHFHVSAKGPGKSAVEKNPQQPPASVSTKYASYFVTPLETPKHPKTSFHRILLSSTKSKGLSSLCHQLKVASGPLALKRSNKLCFRKEVLPKKKMVILRAEKGLLKKVIRSDSLSLCRGNDEKCHPMTTDKNRREQYRIAD